MLFVSTTLLAIVSATPPIPQCPINAIVVVSIARASYLQDCFLYLRLAASSSSASGNRTTTAGSAFFSFARNALILCNVSKSKQDTRYAVTSPSFRPCAVFIARLRWFSTPEWIWILPIRTPLGVGDTTQSIIIQQFNIQWKLSTMGVGWGRYRGYQTLLIGLNVWYFWVQWLMFNASRAGGQRWFTIEGTHGMGENVNNKIKQQSGCAQKIRW